MKITEQHLISNRIKSNTDTSRVDEAYKDFKEEIKKYKEKDPIPEKDIYRLPSFQTVETSPCLHDQCDACKKGVCSKIHMLSCPCSKCTPWSMTTDTSRVVNRVFTQPRTITIVGRDYRMSGVTLV